MKFSQYLLNEAKYKLVNVNSEEEGKSDEKQQDTPEVENSEEKSENQEEASSEEGPNEENSNENSSEESEENSDRQGLIRTVKGAHLIYKRKEPDGTFSELWIYEIQKGLRDEFETRQAILDGTDIDQKTGQSKDEKQYYELWTSNDRQMMKIYGLVN